jgi:hypothetical protein
MREAPRRIDRVSKLALARGQRRRFWSIRVKEYLGGGLPMKNTYHHPNRSLFVLATVACLAIGWAGITPVDAGKPSLTAAPKTQETGRLVILRSANLGSAVVGLKIDGMQTALINFNGRYDAPLAAGKHALTVAPVPPREAAQPTQTQVTVEKGKTYTFTARRADVNIVLQ